MLGRALLLASPTQVCHVFVGMAAIAHLVLVVTDWLYGMYGFGSFVDDTHVCLAWQRILAAFASEWICVRGGIDPEGSGWIMRWESSRRCWIHQQTPYEIIFAPA